MAKIVNSYLDIIEITKLKMAKDADKILEAIDLDELLLDPESYLLELGSSFLDEHSEEIKKGFEEGKKFANKIMEKS